MTVPRSELAGWRFDPDAYPGRRPDGPVLVTDDAERPVSIGADRLPEELRWSVAYGANADPDRLRDKGLAAEGALLLPAVLTGWRPAFEARRTRYGSVPLTLVPAPGVRTPTWVLGIRAALTGRLDRTEGRAGGPADRAPTAGDESVGATGRPPGGTDPPPGGTDPPPGTYRLGVVGDVEVAGSWWLRPGLAYLPGPAARVQVVDDDWRCWPAYDQAAAHAHLERSGPSRPAPQAGATVVGAWPATRLVRRTGEQAI